LKIVSLDWTNISVASPIDATPLYSGALQLTNIFAKTPGSTRP